MNHAMTALALLLLNPLGAWAQGVFYGSCIQADALANTPIGKAGLSVSYRFRAKPGGPLQAIRPYLIWSFRKQGYHAGTGGLLKVELQTDDGSAAHLPSGKALAMVVQRMSIVPTSDRFFPQLFFDRAPLLEAGKLYHVVFTNTDPDPEGNFVSVNALFNRDAGTPQQPGLPDTDWAMLFRSTAKPAWVLRCTPGEHESFTPILEVDYANGQSQGMGYIEFWMGAPKPIAGAAAVREVFTVTGPARRASSVSVRVRRLEGHAPLQVTLERGDGQVLASGQGEGRELSPSPTGSLGGCAWVTCAFLGEVLLSPGKTYHLVLTCPGPGRFEAFPMRKGTDKGFSDATLFGDGHAEANDGHGWAGWEQWGKRGLTNADLQFYFACAASGGIVDPRAARPRGSSGGQGGSHQTGSARALPLPDRGPGGGSPPAPGDPPGQRHALRTDQ